MAVGRYALVWLAIDAGMSGPPLRKRPATSCRFAQPAALPPESLAPNMELPSREEFTPFDTEYSIVQEMPPELMQPYGQAVFPRFANIPLNIYGFTVAESFRGLPDGHFQNNDGAKKGLNVGLLVPGLEELGIGMQFGASLGLYDTTGRYSVPYNTGGWQEQAFITAGLFRRASHGFAGGCGNRLRRHD